MVWQQNLMNNLLVIGILLGLFIIIYCKIKGVTLIDVFREINAIGKLE